MWKPTITMCWWRKVWNSCARSVLPVAALKPTSGFCPKCGRRLKFQIKETPREVMSLVTLMCPMCDKAWGPYRV